ncbi:MAG: leucyl aminopeptidase family protein [Proteobacteria bacterium]|nr:leucyl aminopeptidase family protein [Pseudomonadota bacterium]
MTKKSASAQSVTAKSLPVHLSSEAGFAKIAKLLSPAARQFSEGMGFAAKSGAMLVVPGTDGKPEAALFGTGSDEGLADNPFLAGKLATDLPPGRYHLAGKVAKPQLVYLAFLLGKYRFSRYRKHDLRDVTLDAPEGCDAATIERTAEIICMGRDLINTPANDLTTADLAAAAKALAKAHKAKFKEIVGDDLLEENFPLIHAVGKASAVPPRLVDIRWGATDAPKVTLVGKGVVFDTGGLDLKTSASMLLMRKDMGGAATALTTAALIMASGINVRLRVLLPIVENAVSGLSFRPGDIYPSRKGITVEIGNTDAEGRLILADALTLADEEKPDLLVDFATLTGAARVALGPELPPFYTDDEALAAEIARISGETHDPVWRMPLWKPYQAMLDSKYADTNNTGASGFAGSITAALFLKRFVSDTSAYAHFDIYGWNPSAKPGKPEGGEPQAARLVAALVAKRFAQK